MVNLSKLNNITTLTIDTSNYTDAPNLVPNMINTANTTSDGYLGLGIMIALFIFLTYVLFRDDGDIRLDIAKSLLKSSGFTVIIGTILLVTGVISSFQHYMWFVIIFILVALWNFNLNKKQ